MNELPGEWIDHKYILVILAHPDDPEFFCGATLAKWSLAGHDIHYIIATNGDKGGRINVTPSEFIAIRQMEQQRAGQIIGVKSVNFLGHEDGYLVPELKFRREIVRIIRREKPNILITCDPLNLFPSSGYGINHPDHRAIGQIVLDSVFPAAGNAHFFPELFTEEGLEPHTPEEVWISLAKDPTIAIDVTNYWEIKINALKEHKSQIGDLLQFEARMRSYHTENSSIDLPRYEEKFRVVKFRPR